MNRENYSYEDDIRKHQERIDRALNQRMYLISAENQQVNNWNFIVEGSTGTNYKLNISDKMKCTCIDFKKRKKNCKHLIFILGRVINKLDLLSEIGENPEVNLFDICENLNNIFINKLKNRTECEEIVEEIIGEKENVVEVSIDPCTICYEDILSSEFADKSIKCKKCRKYFHSECIKIWIKRSKTCPLCRNKWGEILIRSESDDALSKLSEISFS